MKIPNEVKSGISTAAFTFVALFIPALLGWLSSIASWASASGHAPLPGISTLGYAAVSALLAALTGVLTTVFRWVQGHSNVIPGEPPTFSGGK